MALGETGGRTLPLLSAKTKASGFGPLYGSLHSSCPCRATGPEDHEMRVVGMAIALASGARILVVVYVVGGFVERVVLRFG